MMPARARQKLVGRLIPVGLQGSHSHSNVGCSDVCNACSSAAASP